MALTLHFHPLSSFCQKALIALYENETPFTPNIVDLGAADQRAALEALWPMIRFPVLSDSARGAHVPEASIIIEYVQDHFPGRTRFIPADVEQARAVRLADRIFDLYVNEPMQRCVAERLRPADAKDPFGAEQARTRLATAIAMLEREMQTRIWAAGDDFSMADCAAAPALFYADQILECFADHPNLAAYYRRLRARPSYARVIAEAQPYFGLFPKG